MGILARPTVSPKSKPWLDQTRPDIFPNRAKTCTITYNNQSANIKETRQPNAIRKATTPKDIAIYNRLIAAHYVYFLNMCVIKCVLACKKRPLSNYASVPTNNNLKSRLRAKFSYTICCIFSHEASTSGDHSRELKRNMKVVY